MTGRLGIDDVSPAVGDGRHPSKAVVGEVIPVRASVWREGHDAVAANVVWKKLGSTDDAVHVRMVPDGVGNDRFVGTVVPDEPGLWTFRVDAWSDPWATWRHGVQAKMAAGQTADEMANDLEIGARLLQRVGRRPSERANRDLLFGAANALRDHALPLHARVAPAMFPAVHTIMTERPVRELITRGRAQQVYVDRPRALYGSWYEFFPRSTGGRDETGRAVHGSFVTAAKELDRIAGMGFDIVYLPPIHPVGTVHRKGRNNSVNAEPGDVGSPWAIGSAAGGHDAIDPELGTFEDFDAFVARCEDLGMEVALDLALQCAPDHPWVTEHPEWFTARPDGTIAYAENPPKKYQDIYPLNFDNDPAGLYAECLRVVLLWISHGVTIFRVDNPHTKPPNFWHWLIWQVKARHPEVLFLAEAFTRPARLFGLARLGFTQSYTYFTWRTTKEELTEFALMHAERADEARPNLFVNTPDILHESLQTGGPAMFAIRATLAATMSPTWGVYSGFELYEGEPVKPGSEEYKDSEKYELRPRDFQAALNRGESLEPYITRLNEIRKAHPALQQLRDIHFHDVDNDAIIAYSRTDPATGDTVLVVCTLDSHEARVGTTALDMPALGLNWGDRFFVVDEVTGDTYEWGQFNYVRLEPWAHVAHIFRIVR
ncbi:MULTISPECIES: alpha-1,4-glucan--maltose-1-phosphate maltosyltransferase [Pseudonocardia]|jgi:starch synthase (maltosyl-transferring)|uniref:Alpha-1,4-glucan:maltose-1-phosphate maltosyltransferase n=1 Tax=Pseudonocardia dioxanivorans (strain ATCC 55486 / DSM 44775 / JCM 13855 / CB1190) TaxID=675635 RepID=F4CKX2_PSEUX|nr:alpha-1,4-glucan--maltose-1-phosphate maltosyltransferase [Pseudonocardia dioxanivorans]AEA23965.1 alpha amylase catalytic region [Pseudonocardia dioxanivorans CB1190]GJF05164.1 alpha-1,4-glucan:maltose-1-phosphate maltosyltransferase [Pseudonocardia sp. D17]